MIRFFLIIFLFISHGNFLTIINNLIILLLINIAFFSVLKSKKIMQIDYLLFILATLLIEILLDLPLLISSVTIIIPLLLLSFTLNNISIHKSFNSFIILFASLLVFLLIDFQLIFNFDLYYFLSFLIFLLFNFIGLTKYGKK